MLVQPPQYAATALLRIDHLPTHLFGELTLSAALDQHAREWLRASDPADAQAASAVAALHSTNDLRVTVLSRDFLFAQRAATEAANGFIAQLLSHAQLSRDRATPDELLLTRQIATLRDALGTGGQPSPAPQPDDPRTMHGHILSEWTQLKNEFESLRAAATRAEEHHRNLLDTPPPTEGVVTAEARRKAHDADLTLSQDFKQLAVHLAALQAELLSILTRSSESINDLEQASEALSALLPARIDAPSSAPTTPQSQFAAAAQGYLTSLQSLAQAAPLECTALQAAVVDPYRPVVLDDYLRLHALVVGFLFEATRQFAEMRKALNDLAEHAPDTPETHVQHSQRVRAFSRAHAEYRRFELLLTGTQGIDAAHNLRLDAELRAARGLARRTRQMVRAIDDKLREQARDEASRLHAQAVIEAEHNARAARDALTAVVNRILGIQEQLNHQSQAVEHFLMEQHTAELRATRTETFRIQLVSAEMELDELQRRRLQAPEPSIRLIGSHADPTPANLYQRLRLSSLGALAALLITGLGQWWAGRSD